MSSGSTPRSASVSLAPAVGPDGALRPALLSSRQTSERSPSGLLRTPVPPSPSLPSLLSARVDSVGSPRMDASSRPGSCKAEVGEGLWYGEVPEPEAIGGEAECEVSGEMGPPLAISRRASARTSAPPPACVACLSARLSSVNLLLERARDQRWPRTRSTTADVGRRTLSTRACAQTAS